MESPKKSAPLPMIPIINHEARNYQITAYVPRVVTEDSENTRKAIEATRGGPVVSAHETKICVLLPGLNYVPQPILQASRFDPNKSNVKCEIKDPTDLADFLALALVENTTSKQALLIWRTAEARPSVTQALDAKLQAA